MTFKYILIWLGIFIIGSLVVNFLIYPSSFDSFKSNLKDFATNPTLDGNNYLEYSIEEDIISEEIKESKIIKTKSKNSMPCSKELNRYIQRQTIKYSQISSDYKLNILEKKRFDSNEEIKMYIWKLNPISKKTEDIIIRKLIDKNIGEEIYIILLKQTGTIPPSPFIPIQTYSNERLIGVCMNDKYEEIGNIDWEY